uniref:Uncharacterized protein n=1 Tax=Opuntia streptacantha TaxID=393608 RepID=A0A7C8ZKR9_OPUST
MSRLYHAKKHYPQSTNTSMKKSSVLSLQQDSTPNSNSATPFSASTSCFLKIVLGNKSISTSKDESLGTEITDFNKGRLILRRLVSSKGDFSLFRNSTLR